jgi:hypothetical protein
MTFAIGTNFSGFAERFLNSIEYLCTRESWDTP